MLRPSKKLFFLSAGCSSRETHHNFLVTLILVWQWRITDLKLYRLGHGTHVGGIETTATFDKETDEFVIHSPTITSAKYWPGGIAFSASHTILMARLIIHGKDHGVHAFMVQLRSLKDFKPVPGIELGDIG
jgi:alkylation response protein AidB-like acyl-CoA dehydrogenase